MVYVFTHEYTIKVQNWEKKVITITMVEGTSFITASGGAIDNDNGLGLELSNLQGSSYIGTSNTWSSNTSTWSSNQVNWMDNTSNNFYLTQVQMVVLTDFEHLVLCRRTRHLSVVHQLDGGDYLERVV